MAATVIEVGGPANFLKWPAGDRDVQILLDHPKPNYPGRDLDSKG